MFISFAPPKETNQRKRVRKRQPHPVFRQSLKAISRSKKQDAVRTFSGFPLAPVSTKFENQTPVFRTFPLKYYNDLTFKYQFSNLGAALRKTGKRSGTEPPNGGELGEAKRQPHPVFRQSLKAISRSKKQDAVRTFSGFPLAPVSIKFENQN